MMIGTTARRARSARATSWAAGPAPHAPSIRTPTKSPSSERAGDVVAGGPGAQGDVEQDDIEVLLSGACERLLPVGHGGHAMSLALEGAREHVAERLVVVDDEDVER